MSQSSEQGDPFGMPKEPRRGRSRSGGENYAGRESAGPNYRVGGWIVDAFATLAIGLGAGVLAAKSMTDDEALGVAFAVGFVAWILNTIVLVSLTHGQSIGKLVAGMRLVNEDGSPVGAWVGFVRDTLLRLLYLFGPFFLIDSLWVLSSENRTLRDKIVGTRVVREPAYARRVLPLLLAVVLSWGALAAAIDAAPESWGEDGYNADDRTAWLDICGEDEATPRSACLCAYDYVRARVDYSQFERYMYRGYGSPSVRTKHTVNAAFDRCFGGPAPGESGPTLRS